MRLLSNNHCEVEYKSYKIALYSQVRKLFFSFDRSHKIEE